MVQRGGLACVGLLLLAVAFFPSSYGSSSPGLRFAEVSRVRVEGRAPQRIAPSSGWARRAAAAARPEVDFNCDGRQDFLTSSHLADLPNSLGELVPNAGAAYVAYGKPNGALANGQRLTIVDASLEPHRDDQFGRSITVGHIDLDGCTDVVVGMDGFDAQFGSIATAGAVVLYRGSRGGLEFSRLIEHSKAGEAFGHAVSLANLDGEEGDELIVSAIGARVRKKASAGKLLVFSASYLRGDSNEPPQTVTRASLGFKPRANDFWGTSLFAGDFNHDLNVDIGVGAEFANDGAGIFNVVYGPGLSEGQEVSLPNGRPGQRFGHAGVSLRLNDDDFPDPLVTVPGFDDNTGAAFGLLSSEDGLTGQALLLDNPESARGDFDWWDVDHIGGPGHNTLASGAPGTDLVLDGDLLAEGGGVNLIGVRYLKGPDAYALSWDKVEIGRHAGPTRPQETTWNQTTHSGWAIGLRSIRAPKLWELAYGEPGLTCDLEDHSGAIAFTRLKFDPDRNKKAKVLRRGAGGSCYAPPLFPAGQPWQGDEFGQNLLGF